MESFIILKFSKDPLFFPSNNNLEIITILKLTKKIIQKILFKIKYKFRNKHNFKTYKNNF